MYMVKFPVEGKICYGIHQEYDEESKKLAKSGFTIVHDAILPKAYKVKIKDMEEIKMEMGKYRNGRWVDQDEYHTFVEDEFEKARKLSASLKGFVPGKLFSVGVADGNAWYVVTKVSGKSCTIEWRGFCLDRYMDHYLGYGGFYPVSKIKRYVDFEEGMAKLFSRGA